MKKLAYVIFAASIVVLAISGFKTVTPLALQIKDCRLQSGNAIFTILPGLRYKQDDTSIQVKIYNQNGTIAALGSRKIELLHVPDEGVHFRVPLSKPLEQRKQYSAEITVESLNDGVRITEIGNLRVSGVSSMGFFEKNFKPITEPSELRNQISAAQIRQNIRWQ